MKILQSKQTIGRHAHGSLCLLGLNNSKQCLVSPYFQTVASTREEAPSRDIKSSLNYMDFLIDSWGASGGNPYAVVSWWNSSNVFQNSAIIFMVFGDIRANGLSATVTAAINDYATTNSITVASIKALPGVLQGAPQAAVANAPADAITNYNTITTLLGAVTGAVNTANDKQNQIGAQLNSLLAELRTLGVIAT